MKKSLLLPKTMLLSLTLVTLTACGGNKDDVAKQVDNNKTVKTSKSDKKEDKPSSEKSSDKSTQSEFDENDVKTEASSAIVGNSSSQVSDTQTLKEGGTGVAIVTSGTLDLWEDTPVYTEPNKAGTIAFTKAKDTSVDWDKYFQENDDWWYSFVDKSSGQEIRYYIAYSDVKH